MALCQSVLEVDIKTSNLAHSVPVASRLLTDSIVIMSRQQIADRLGATATLSDPKRMARSTVNICSHLPGAQILAVTSRHVETQTDASPEISPRIAAALALPDGAPREAYLKEVADRESVDRYAASLRFIDSLMDEADRLALHQEVCTAVGTVH